MDLERRAQVTADLLRLRALNPQFAGSSFIHLFDEFVEHHEFGLALVTICDWFNETKISPESETVATIDMLHQLMKMEDEPIVLQFLQHAKRDEGK